MNAGFLDVLHDAGDERVLAVAQAIDVHFRCVRQIAVDQQRALFGDHQFRRAVAIAWPPIKWPGRITTGYPISSARARAAFGEVAMPFCGLRTFSLWSNFLK